MPLAASKVAPPPRYASCSIVDVAETLTSNASRRRIEDLVMRIEGEFLATPDLRLTIADAERRFGADEVTCEAVLEALVDATVLFKTHDRVYGRLFPHIVAA
jgi:hypothetical protein